MTPLPEGGLSVLDSPSSLGFLGPMIPPDLAAAIARGAHLCMVASVRVLYVLVLVHALDLLGVSSSLDSLGPMIPLTWLPPSPEVCIPPEVCKWLRPCATCTRTHACSSSVLG